MHVGNEWESGQLVRAKLQVYGHLASWPVIPLENKKTGLLLPKLIKKVEKKNSYSRIECERET